MVWLVMSGGVSIAASNAEVAWCAYAWPTSHGNSGNRAFFVNQIGDVLSCRNATQRYSGTTKVPSGRAASGPLVSAVAGVCSGSATSHSKSAW